MVGFGGPGFADNILVTTSKREYNIEDPDAFNTIRRPRRCRKLVRSGSKTNENDELVGDGDVVKFKRPRRPKARRYHGAADGNESDYTDIAKPVGSRQRRGWTSLDEERLQKCVEMNMSWQETAKRLKRSEGATT